jgi:hypothetical protein
MDQRPTEIVAPKATPMHLGQQFFAALAATAIGASVLLVAAPAKAAPVFTDAQTELDPFGGGFSYAYAGTNDCTNVPAGGNEPTVPVVENGPAASVSTSASATFANTSIPGDTATGTASASGTGKVTSVAGNLATVDLSVTSNAQLTNALGTSPECVREVYSGVDLEFEFTVTQAGFLTLTTKNVGGSYGEVRIDKLDASAPDDTQPYVDNYGSGVNFDATTKVYLPAGTYKGYFEGEAYKYSKSSNTISGTSTMHADFQVAGSQTEAVSGKAKKYVSFPAARSCATHVLATKITNKKNRAEDIKQVTFFVNDHKVKKVNTPSKGDAVNLPVADNASSDVTVEVKLFPARKGKPGKVYEASASYEACAG